MIDQNLTVTADTVANAAISYLENNDLSNLLHKNGGRFKAGKSWCNELLTEMNLPRRKCTTQASKLPADWETQGRRLELQVCRCMAGIFTIQCGNPDMQWCTFSNALKPRVGKQLRRFSNIRASRSMCDASAITLGFEQSHLCADPATPAVSSTILCTFSSPVRRTVHVGLHFCVLGCR